MKITTQDSFIDFEISETLGLVKGNTIRARHIGKDIMASLRTLVGGEITEYGPPSPAMTRWPQPEGVGGYMARDRMHAQARSHARGLSHSLSHSIHIHIHTHM